MSKSILSGSVILILSVLVAGCARAPKDKDEVRLVKEQIAVLNTMTSDYQKITDKDSMTKHKPGLKVHWDKFAKISQEFHALANENKADALTNYGEELAQALARMTAAKANAEKVGASLAAAQ